MRGARPRVRTAGAILLLMNSAAGALAQAAREDTGRFCPQVSQELSRRISALLKDDTACEVPCHGCGCKGGPGYRENSTDRCVGWRELIEKCGPPPHGLCSAECEPVVPGCEGRAWIKDVAKKAGIDVPFVEGRERPGKESGSRQKLGISAQQVNPADPATFECSGKRTCKEMASCDEAIFYLNTCGVSSLDGDGDGVPCNQKCRRR